MLKFDNTCTEYPNMTRVLDEMLYRKRKTQNISQTILANLIGRSRNCIQQAECHEHLPALFTILSSAHALEFSDEEFTCLMLALWVAFQADLQFQSERSGWYGER